MNKVIFHTLVPLFFFVLLVSFPSFRYSFDSVVFMIQHNLSANEGRPVLEHIHHPFKDYLGWGIVSLLRRAGFEGELIGLFQILSLVAATTALLFFGKLLDRTGLDRTGKFVFSALLAFSNGYLLFASQYEVYSFGILGLILFLLAEKAQSRCLLPILVAILPLLHQTLLLFPLCYGVIAYRERDDRWKLYLKGLLGYFFVVVLIVFSQPAGMEKTILLGHMGHPRGVPLRLYEVSVSNLANSLKRAGGMVFAPWQGGVFAGTIVSALLILLTARGCRSSRESVKVSLVMVLYLVFLVIWDRGVSDMWVFLLPLVFYLSSLLRPFETTPRWLIVLPILLVAWNFKTGILPASIRANNTDLLLTDCIRTEIPPEDIVVLSGLPGDQLNNGKVYIPYFAKREVLILDWAISSGKPVRTFQDRVLIVPEYLWNKREEYSRELIARHGGGGGKFLETLFQERTVRGNFACAGVKFVRLEKL